MCEVLYGGPERERDNHTEDSLLEESGKPPAVT